MKTYLFPFLSISCVVLMSCGCLASEKTGAKPASRVSEEMASKVLGKKAKKSGLSVGLGFSGGESDKNAIQEQTRRLESFLEHHSIDIFSTESGFYAFTQNRHILIASRWGGFRTGDLIADFNNDGRGDLLVSYEVGSGMVRPNSTLVLDTKDGLQVFHIHGVPRKQGDEWRITHPLEYFGYGKDKENAILHFSAKGATIAWPEGTKEKEKWTMGQPGAIVRRVNWAPNKELNATDKSAP